METLTVQLLFTLNAEHRNVGQLHSKDKLSTHCTVSYEVHDVRY